MKRKMVNLLALFVIGLGFAVTGMAAPSPGTNPNMMAQCTSGDGEYTCNGMGCSAGWDWCCGDNSCQGT